MGVVIRNLYEIMMEDLKGLKAAFRLLRGLFRVNSCACGTALQATAIVGPHLFDVFRELS
jgi:hypothetical protein